MRKIIISIIEFYYYYYDYSRESGTLGIKGNVL